MQTSTEPMPGLHRVPFREYLRWRIMSQSVLKRGRDSMAHLKAAWDGDTEPPTDAMVLGSALHTAFLEPELFDEKVALWDGGSRAGAEWRAFAAENEHRAILTPGFHKNLVGMVAALRRHPEVKRWSDRTTDVELSCVGDLHGTTFKGRIDALTDDPLWDLKKCASTADRAIVSAINDYGYHIQAYCYMQLFGRDRFCLGFVEDSPPYDVRVVELSPAWIRIGRQETLSLIQRYQWCLKHDKWPGRSDEIELLEPPTWLSDRYGDPDSILIGEEAAFAGDEP